jgi:hypothetical protein
MRTACSPATGSACWTCAPIGPDYTELAFGYARYHSRFSVINMRRTTPGTPNNAEGITEYPRGVRVFALEGKHNFKPVTVYGSVGYSPNRPLGYVIAEVAQAVGNRTARSVFRPGVEAAMAAGEWYEGWDRRRTSDWQLGATHQLKDVLGASIVNLQGEVNARFVHNLPDPSQLRYLRPDVFGTGPVPGFPNGGCGPQLGCTNEGYLTKSAWSYTLQANATYPKALGPVTLRPRLAVSHDVEGYSADNLVKEGRVRLALGLDAVYDRSTTLSLAFVRDLKRSDYDNGRDRSYLFASLSTRF